MTYVGPRFECLVETAGTWMVWDHVTHCLADLAGVVLRGREEQRAKAACSVLTKIYGCRLDARSVRLDIRRR
jgi:hypothetical protein